MSTILDPLTLPLWGSRLIEASAGTGKTWTIAALYLRLVLGHGDDDTRFARPLAPSQILVMTFTRAATRELTARIRSRLVGAAKRLRGDDDRDDRDDRDDDGDDDRDPFVDALIAAVPDASARATAAFRLATAAESMDDAAVFTIDAWIGRMLREHAFDSGSLFDERLQPDEQAMFVEAVLDYWRQEVYPLRDEALEDALAAWSGVDALLHDVRAMTTHVTIADDGTSLAATRLEELARRTAALRIVKQDWPARIDEMRGWLTSQLSVSDGPFDRTKLKPKLVDGWLDALVHWVGDPAQFGIGLKPAAIYRLSRAGLLECVKPDCTVDLPVVFDILAALPAALSTIEHPTDAMRLHAAARVASRLRQLKQRAGVHGFGDLLERLDAALDGPGGERLRTRIVEQFPVAMIDEFQDTSPLQYRIFDRLYRTAGNARDTALLLIGDPKQSIYAFRGADIQSYLRARRATTDRHYLLTTNHRSQPALVAAINRLFVAAEGRSEGAFRFGSTHHEPASPLPFVPVTAVERDRTLHATSGPTSVLTICHDALLGTRDDATRRFAEHAAEDIAISLDDRGAGFVDTSGRFTRLAPADIAVLVRDRTEAAAIRAALQRRGIASAYLSDQESVFASDEAVDLLHWLRAVAEPFDGRRARLAFATNLIGLALEEIAAIADDDAVFEMRLDQLRLLHDIWQSQGVLPMIRRTLHLLDLPARWLARADGERRLTNVLHLAELLQQSAAGGNGDEALIRWFADHVDSGVRSDDEQVVRLESDADLVRVVTIHKAKGLEYPLVYLPFVCGVRERRWQNGGVAFPADADGTRHVAFRFDDAVKASVRREDEQEDLRLLYVASTRAQHALWIGIAPIRVGHDPACAFHRSGFGYLLTGGEAVDEHGIATRLAATFGDLPSVTLKTLTAPAARTRVPRNDRSHALIDPSIYTASFERDWSIGSFSGWVRDLSRGPKPRALVAAMVGPAVEEEIASGPNHEPVSLVVVAAPRHRFPRGALAGNFLHDQLEWLATEQFAVDRVEAQLVQRCERQGWGLRAADVVTWLAEVTTTSLPPIGTSLARLSNILPEMEFWLPSERVDASAVDRLCHDALLDGLPDGHERPALPERTLSGMLMGFADLVFEVDGRYWVLDYKSNALGDHDHDYTADAITLSMAEHRYDVQGALYLLALHRLLSQRLGDRYDPATQIGGALYLYLRGIHGPVHGCHVLAPDVAWLARLDALFAGRAVPS
jgi:exodeoxyribonuclease V beta subunit